MGRVPRNTDSSFLHHVSIRTIDAQLLLTPSEALNNLIGGVIAKYQLIHRIEIYAFMALSNHIHLVARAPWKNLWLFEQEANREIAKRVNRLRRRRGPVWARRYDEQICPEDKDALDALLYVICNAVKHGLVDSPEKWPGLNCYADVFAEEPRWFTFVDYTAYSKAVRAAKRGKKKRLG